MDLVDYGFFCPLKSVGAREAPETERGIIDLVEGEVHPELVTTRIPAELGASFGIKYRLPKGMGERSVMVVNMHPPFGDPPVIVDRYWAQASDADSSVALFTFDSTYEIQLGTWTYSIIMDGEVVLQKSFEVVEPSETEATVEMCDPPEMMM